MAQENRVKTTPEIVLERPCTECDGKGGESDEYTGDFYPCDACDGTGYVLTDSGNNLFSFLENMWY